MGGSDGGAAHDVPPPTRLSAAVSPIETKSFLMSASMNVGGHHSHSECEYRPEPARAPGCYHHHRPLASHHRRPGCWPSDGYWIDVVISGPCLIANRLLSEGHRPPACRPGPVGLRGPLGNLGHQGRHRRPGGRAAPRRPGRQRRRADPHRAARPIRPQPARSPHRRRLASLGATGRAQRRRITTAGRPAEVWAAADPAIGLRR